MTSVLPFEETEMGRAITTIELSLYQIKNLVETEASGKELIKVTQTLAVKSIASLEVLRQLIYKTSEEYKRNVEMMVTGFNFRLDEVTAMQVDAKAAQEQAKSMQERAIAVQEHMTSELNEMLGLIAMSSWRSR